MRDLLVSQVVETTVVEQKQILERGREQIGIQRLDAPQRQSRAIRTRAERKHVLEHDQEWHKAEALARATASHAQARQGSNATTSNPNKAIDLKSHGN